MLIGVPPSWDMADPVICADRLVVKVGRPEQSVDEIR
jgi:hypothetical protein